MTGLLDMFSDKRKKDDLGKTEALMDQKKMANKMGYSKVPVSESLAKSGGKKDLPDIPGELAGKVLNKAFKDKSRGM